MRGDEPLRIQWRGGHTDFSTTQGYIAAGRDFGAGFGAPFPALPAALVGGDVEGLQTSAPSPAERDEPADPARSAAAPAGTCTTNPYECGDRSSHDEDRSTRGASDVGEEEAYDDASVDLDWSNDRSPLALLAGIPGDSGQLGWRPQWDSNTGDSARSGAMGRKFARSEREVRARLRVYVRDRT